MFRDNGVLKEASQTNGTKLREKEWIDSTHWLAIGDERQTCFGILETFNYLVEV